MTALRRVAAFVAAASLIAISSVVVQPAAVRAGGPAFTDVGNFPIEIEWLRDAGITLGCNEGGTLFCPLASVTREQMASFIVRAQYLAPTSTDYFVDDEASAHHENDINALRERGITNGCGTDQVSGSPTFGSPIYCPSEPVTREQMASFISRALGLPNPTGDHFDDDEASVFHENDINKMYEAGITLGCGGRNYCPGQAVTREQMAAFLYRALTVDLEALPETLGTVGSAVAHLFGDVDIPVPASCGGDPEVNCTDGNPSNPGNQLGLTASTTSAGANASDFSFSAAIAVASLQDIPVSISGNDCTLQVDTAPGASATVTVAGTLDFAAYDADGPSATQWPPSADLNRLTTPTVATSGWEAVDFQLGGPLFCQLANPGLAFFVGIVGDAIEGYAGDAAPCGPAGPELFITCPTVPYVGV